MKKAVAQSASDAARGAQERLVAALADRPIVDVSVTVHAPRVAVPSNRVASKDESRSRVNPGADFDEYLSDDPATLLLDLGKFELRTVPATDLGASAQNANLFNAFRVKISDVSASLLSGPWDPNDSWRLAIRLTCFLSSSRLMIIFAGLPSRRRRCCRRSGRRRPRSRRSRRCTGTSPWRLRSTRVR